MAQDYSQVNFRIPTKLKEKIEAAAASNERSITGELVDRLEKSFEQENSVIVTKEDFSTLRIEYALLSEQVENLIKTLNKTQNAKDSHE